jgi:Asp/Glu/hydantoin racemase
VLRHSYQNLDANGSLRVRRIALIHATPVAIDPIAEAFKRDWPDCATVNLLDDSLSQDRARTTDLTADMSRRILALGEYVHGAGADAILYTCSAFGPAIENAARKLPIPVLKPNEAMFEQALEKGKRIGMIATFRASVASMEAEFTEEAGRRNPKATIRTVLVEEAMTQLRAGDAERHNRLVADAAVQLSDCDALVLAQFSTSRAAPAVRAITSQPVLTSPDAAIAKLKGLMR